MHDGMSIFGVSGSVLFLILTLIFGWMSIGPEYRLWRAEIEKRILVEEARAQADSNVILAQARVIEATQWAEAEVARAYGTAEANEIVAGSITEPYLRYLFINQIGSTANQIIYLPTEAGLPILEADRFRQQGAGG